MRKIFVERLKAYGYHGVYEYEKSRGQYFFVSLELTLESCFFDTADELDCTVNYAEVCESVASIVKESRFDLIESLAENIAKTLLLTYPGLAGVSVTVEKPDAPVSAEFQTIGVTVSREWHSVYLSLGSNLKDREKNIREAIGRIGASQECKVCRTSEIIETAPWGMTDQPAFLNCAAEIKTFMEPLELLRLLKNTEREMGRENGVKWGPRIIDADILLYDSVIYSSEELHIPHPYMHERKFVLEPLAEIAPYAVHPLKNLQIRELLSEV
jgi:dihydroneopterin aldolase/2-amino-4-hydroxy-6-hydroxymethyldihydropteridine diphosphokinase